jgi:hypothetical protein
MSRRASLPGAAELFRTTSAPEPEAEPVPAPHPGVGAVPPVATHEVTQPEPAAIATPPARTQVRATRRIRAVGDRSTTGRERHEEKITVYCSPEELVDLETARLHLRAEHGLAVDRGRIVREALAVVRDDLEAKGESSILVRRLREP